MIQSKKIVITSGHNLPKRLYALDISRGIAALSVVLWHWQHFAYIGNSTSQGFIRVDQPAYKLLRLFYEKGNMGVEYFFLLSGFIFFWRYRDSIRENKTTAWEFAVERFSRLYPLHFITLIAVAILQFLYISRENIPFVYPFNDTFHFFLNIFFASNWGFEKGYSFNAPVCSVSIEVLLYGVFYLTTLLRQGGGIFCLSVSVSSFILNNFFVQHYIFRGLAMFFLGGLVFYLAILLSDKHKKLKTLVYILAFFSWTCVIINFYTIDLSNMILDIWVQGRVFLFGFTSYILFPLTILCLILIEIDTGARLLRHLSWIGDITYSSYLLHFPLQIVFSLAVSFKIIDVKFYLNPVYLLFYFSLLIPLSYIAFVKLERPIQKTLRIKLLPNKYS